MIEIKYSIYSVTKYSSISYSVTKFSLILIKALVNPNHRSVNRPTHLRSGLYINQAEPRTVSSGRGKLLVGGLGACAQ